LKTGHIWQVLLILIGALASAYAGYWIGHQPEESLVVERIIKGSASLII